VDGREDVVAKLYARGADAVRAEKIGVMARAGTDRLRALRASPLAPLSPEPGGTARGFLMPRVVDGRPVHALYTPKSRKAQFPGATWSFVTVGAANVARAFAVMHQHGVAIGDVNHDNVFVLPDGRVTLI